MDNYTIAREKFLIGCHQFLNKENTEKVGVVFDAIMRDFELVTRETGLVVYDNSNIEMLINYYSEAMLNKNLSEKTLNNKKITLRKFFVMVGKYPADVVNQDIYIYKFLLKQDGVAPNTINTYLSTISAFYTWMVKRGLVKANPITNEDMSKCPDKEKFPLSAEQIEDLRDCLTTDRERALIETMLSSGMRREELCKAQISHIMYKRKDEHGNVPILIPEGKGGKMRFAILSKKAVDCIETYIANRGVESPYLFLGLRGTQMSTVMINRLFEDLRSRCGIDFLTPHTLRRTFATRAVQSGVGINFVARVMGHSSVDTTMIYAKDSLETIMEQFEDVL